MTETETIFYITGFQIKHNPLCRFEPPLRFENEQSRSKYQQYLKGLFNCKDKQKPIYFRLWKREVINRYEIIDFNITEI